MSDIQQIGNIGNYYGGLAVKKENGLFYWGIENWDGTSWDQIPESLNVELINYITSGEIELCQEQPTDRPRATEGVAA